LNRRDVSKLEEKKFISTLVEWGDDIINVSIRLERKGEENASKAW